MENAEKVQNYKGGEIKQTVGGYYIFRQGDAHSGPYVSISAAKEHGHYRRAGETPAVESADGLSGQKLKYQ